MGIKNSILRAIGDKRAKYKGHELIIQHENEIFGTIQKDSYVVEIGSEREAGSTRIIAELANKHDVTFITVDFNQDTTAAAENIVKSVNKKFEAVNDFGEKFLERFSEELSLVYLDAFDLAGDWHPAKLADSYRKKGVELTNENCYKMHLDCAVALCRKMKKGTYVCFDDVNPVDEEGHLILRKVESHYPYWSGKGKTAIPYMLKNGFKLIDNKRACALLVRINLS